MRLRVRTGARPKWARPVTLGAMRGSGALALVTLGVGTALAACTPTVPPAEGREFTADCHQELPCEGTLTVHSARLVEQCRYGPGPWAGTSLGVGSPGAGETYLEITATFDAHSSENPDGVLLDQLAYVDPESGEEVTAPLALACREAANGDVFWTKNVQPGQSARLYQPWVVPEATTEVVIEGERVSVHAAAE